ncbi:hypothetical protein GCM10018793_70240 [Streptomyces sulfonofaciens]|uniref:Uncharacterized protein n=1 Tax=Streptomyces sulfonofaciens TaxID=68272 RepID=A0A919GQJ6_9ACTN|nr:hypothetical protein GCM10018793_70240 [Streptomyces sulfonofaciens]
MISKAEPSETRTHETRDLRVWDLDTLTPVRVLSGHRAALKSAALSVDGRVLVSGDESGHVRVWDTADGRCGRRYELPPQGVELVAVSGSWSRSAATGRWSRWPAWAARCAYWATPSASSATRSTTTARASARR